MPKVVAASVHCFRFSNSRCPIGSLIVVFWVGLQVASYPPFPVSDQDLSVVPETSPISKVRAAPPRFGLRTVSVSAKTAQRFNTVFATTNHRERVESKPANLREGLVGRSSSDM